MGIPWYILIFPFFGLQVHGYVLEVGDTPLILAYTEDITNDKYSIDLKENNHINDSDHLLLFTIKEFTKSPTCIFGSASFVSDTKSSEEEYEFYTNQNIDYETETSHSYLLTCIMDPNVITITINTINYDDESPTLTATVCSMAENADYDVTNTTCTATLSDPDGWLGQTTFLIVNSNPNAVEELEQEDQVFEFSFDDTISDTVYNTTVYLITRRQLDYETKIFYSFVVQAQDGANHSTVPNENVTCIVDVIDVNDMPPQWTDYFGTKQIEEKASYTFSVTAVDGDRGINAPINYTLISYDEDICEGSCVNITTDNGKGIITVDPIDRDAKDITTYKFEIMAQEQDEPPFNITLTITFFVDDIDDNSPLFMNMTRTNDTTIDFVDIDQKIAEFTFFENFASTLDGQIFIQDIDTGEHAQFSVQLNEDDTRKYDNISYTDAFLVIPTAGYRNGDFQISVKNYLFLDFENIPWQEFAFYVHSSGTNSSKEDDLLVQIHLLDYNDELPIFANVSYVTSVNETIHIGEEIITVKATDRDAEDAILKHQLVGADAIINLMNIEPENGTITVAVDNAFDYDRINPVIFQVQAIDKADHTTTVSVTVNLLDINNKAPTYKVEDVIRVDENQNIGIELNARITASDVDTTRNLTAEIDWQKSYAMKNSQKLNSSNPDLLKAMQFLNLTYEKSSVDSISINLIVNDNNTNATAPDYETFDTLYLDITITDLNTDPGFLDKMSIDALIVININDINDNAPEFTKESLAKNRTIYEKSLLDSIVGTIEAIDADVGDTVAYSCTYVDEDQDWFACDESGQITVKYAYIDADTGPVYNVSIDCNATDGFWITPQRFDIYILDTNDQKPQTMVNDTLPSQEVVEVYEKSDAGQIVSRIGASDGDRDVPFKTVQCKIDRTNEDCFDSFTIVDNVITVLNGGTDIDRDTKIEEYVCTSVCYDNPNMEQNQGQNSNSTSFTIRLLDINDHCPEMQYSEPEGSENLMKGETIGLIIAEDLDKDENSEIEMRILTVMKNENNEDVNYTEYDLFGMEKNDSDYFINDTMKRWHLVANKDLRGYYGVYTLQLQLNDKGSPSQSTEDSNNTYYKEKAKLQLTIRPYNYYPPTFIFPNESKLSFSLSADQDPGTQLAMFYNNEIFSNIEIIDDNETKSCIDKWDPEFDVTIVQNSDSLLNFFAIKKLDRCTAQLQITDLYNKAEAIAITTYQIRLTATLDNVNASDGEAEYSSSIELKLNFVDLNDEPVFDQTLGSWNISFLEDNASQILDLPEERKAFYPNVDNSDDMQKYYFLKSDDENVTDTFNVPEDTGTIHLKKKLDYLETTYYEFEILAARNQTGISSNVASRLKVNVDVIDINNHVPQWTQDSYFAAILKSTQKGSTVVTVEATDLDEIDQGKLTYSLNSTIEGTGSESISNIDNAFLVNEKTGNITLNFQVDYNMNGYFSFWVKVQDVQDDYGNGPFDNRASVTIRIVTDDNIVTFKFENPLDTVVKKRLQTLQTISSCLTWDCYDQSIDNYSDNGVTLTNVTAASIYCVENGSSLLTADDIKTKLNNINTFQQLKQELLNDGILLQNFDSDTIAVLNLESTLKAALIGVSVVLGALCLILGVTFFLKARELNRRLSKLTERKFGSDESNINRQGINAPTTNMFAVEGSNPVFSTEMAKHDSMNAEISSIHSGNSDLIGVEDSPEFDDIFGEEKY